MAVGEKKISELTVITTPADTDVYPVVQSGASYKQTALQTNTYINDKIDGNATQTVLTDAMTVLTRNSGASEKTTLAILADYIRGKTLKKFVNLSVAPNTTNPTYQIDVSTDELQIGYIRESSFAAIVDITASGFNGLDTGSEANSTWYYLWAIAGAGQTSGLVLSASLTAPTLPSGYTESVLISAAYNNSSGNFVGFNQINENVVTSTAQVSMATTGSTAQQTSSLVGIIPDFTILKNIGATLYISGYNAASDIYVSTLSAFNEITITASSTGVVPLDFFYTQVILKPMSNVLYFQFSTALTTNTSIMIVNSYVLDI